MTKYEFKSNESLIFIMKTKLLQLNFKNFPILSEKLHLSSFLIQTAYQKLPHSMLYYNCKNNYTELITWYCVINLRKQ